MTSIRILAGTFFPACYVSILCMTLGMEKMSSNYRQKVGLVALVLLLFAACSLSTASDTTVSSGLSGSTNYDLSGKWKMVANQIYDFDLDLQQNGIKITGTMTCTNLASEPVDAISGTVSQGGEIQFTRERPGAWIQVYTGQVSRPGALRTMDGTFTHNGAGQSPWNATFYNRDETVRSRLDNGSGENSSTSAESNGSSKLNRISMINLSLIASLNRNNQAGAATTFETNTNRPGMDYKNFDLSSPNSSLCEQACADDPNCKAFTYVNPGCQGPNAKCWLKSGVPKPVPDNCCASGEKVNRTASGSELTPKTKPVVIMAQNMKYIPWANVQRLQLAALGLASSTSIDYADKNSIFLDWNQENLKSNFVWNTNASNVASAVWQVSILPFPNDVKNWAKPPGLLASGTLSSDVQRDGKRSFTIDFGSFSPNKQETKKYWMNTRPFLSFQKNVLLSLKSSMNSELANNPSNEQAMRLNQALGRIDVAVTDVDSKLVKFNSKTNQPSLGSNKEGTIAARASSILSSSSNSGTSSGSPALNNTKVMNALTHISLNPPRNAAANNSILRTQSTDNIISAAISSSKLQRMKDIMIRLLPQTQRTYYVRVVALDANGNSIGLPSSGKEVVVGEPIIQSAKAMNVVNVGWIAGNNDIKLAAADRPGRPTRHGEFCDNRYQDASKYLESNMSIDSSPNQDQNRWFAWRSDKPNLTAAEWQISLVPFNDEELMNPTGLVARGSLNLGPADLNSASCLPDGFGSCYEFSVDFSKFASVNTTYYIRIVALASIDSPGKYLGYTSKLIELGYGPIAAPKVKINPTTVFMAIPELDVKITKYEPAKFYADDIAPYWFVVVNDSSLQGTYQECSGTPDENGNGVYCTDHTYDEYYHVGDEVNIAPHEDSFWEKLGSFLTDVFSFLVDAVNWVSEKWDWIQANAISLVADTICGGENNTACTSIVGGILNSGLNVGLAALGVPPHIPNFDQLCNGGIEYFTQELVSEVSAETGVDPSLVNMVAPSHDDVRKYVQGCIDGARDAASTGPGGAPLGLNFLRPDPKYQPHPACIWISITNNKDKPTLPGTLTITDSNNLFKLKPIALPPMQANDTMSIPVYMDQNIYQCNIGTDEMEYINGEWVGKYWDGTDFEINPTDWWHMYNDAEDTFTANADTQLAEKEKLWKEQGIWADIINTDPGKVKDTVKIRTNQPWGAA